MWDDSDNFNDDGSDNNSNNSIAFTTFNWLY